MTDVLPRLIKSYEFLRQALDHHRDRLDRSEARRLERERDRAFLDILTHTAGDARVTAAQLRFIAANLEHLMHDPAALSELKVALSRHVEALAARQGEGRAVTLAPVATKGGPGIVLRAGAALMAETFRPLDALSDRVAVFDHQYRYVFTNAANARFHDERAVDFVGRENASVTGAKFFRHINKPRLDESLAGHAQSFICPNPRHGLAMPHSVTFDPLRDEAGTVVAVIAVARDVSHLPIPRELITTFAEA